MTRKSRGRPLGFKLSEESRKAISEAKKGQRHSEATKDKISRTLLAYFRELHPLSSELYDEYYKEIESSDECSNWFAKISQELDLSDDICTERSLNSKRFREISMEYNINMDENPYNTAYVSGPEDICELQEQCELLGLDFTEIRCLLNILV